MSETLFNNQPGALVDYQIEKLIDVGCIQEKGERRVAQPASYDICVSETVYQLAAVPSFSQDFSVEELIKQYCYNTFSLQEGPVVLAKNTPYLIKTTTILHLPEHISGITQSKSTTGRNDMHCRTLIDKARSFNTVTAGYQGELYLLVVPQSFAVRIREGEALSQLRLFSGQRTFVPVPKLREMVKEDGIIQGLDAPVFLGNGIMLHLDLRLTPSNYVANPIGKPLDLHARGTVDIMSFFREKNLDENGNLILEPGEFALGCTCESLKIPVDQCAMLAAYSEEQGEMRTHYAGFFDPGFQGRIVFEIRNIGTTPLLLAHQQPTAITHFEYLSVAPHKTYGGQAVGSNYYQQQGVRLAKQFMFPD